MHLPQISPIRRTKSEKRNETNLAWAVLVDDFHGHLKVIVDEDMAGTLTPYNQGFAQQRNHQNDLNISL